MLVPKQIVALRRLVPAAFVTSAYFFAALFPLNNPDTYGHFAQGRQIAELGSIPRHDSFSFWEGKSSGWNNYEWLADYLMWTGYSAFGPDTMVIAKCVLAALMAVLMLVVGTRSWPAGQGLAARMCLAASLVASLCVVRVRLTLRPHLLGYLCFALGLLLVQAGARACERGSRRPAALIAAAITLLHIFWLNVHGSHLLGLAVVGAYFVGSAWRNGARAMQTRWLACVLLLQLLASGVSPFGYSILLDALEHVLRPEYRVLVSEWGGWSEQTPLVYVVVWCVAAVGIALSARRFWADGTRGLAKLLIALGLLWMAYRSVRFTSLLAMYSCAAAIPYLIGPDWARSASSRLRALWCTGGVLVAIASPIFLTSLPAGMKVGVGESQSFNPHACTSWLARNAPQSRLYSAMDDGWYALFASPQTKVFLDGRVPYYGVEHVNRVARALAAERGLEAELDASGADALLLRMTSARYQSAVLQATALREWGLACIENRHALFLRREAHPEVTFLDALPVGYDVGQVAAKIRQADAASVLSDIARLPNEPSSRAYVLATRGLVRVLSGGGAGLLTSGVEHPASKEVRDHFRVAEVDVRRAKLLLPELPSLELAHIAILSALCEIGRARAELANMSSSSRDNRQAILLDAEIALRAGDRGPLERILVSPEGKELIASDLWLQRLAQEQTGRCEGRLSRDELE